MKQQVLSNKHMWGSISLLCCLVASEAPRAGRRRLSEFPACGVKLYLQRPEYVSGRGLEDVYCATSPTLEFVLDKDEVPVYIGVGCCNDAGVCHRHDGANDDDGCFAGTYDYEANVLDPKTWNQVVDLCHNEGKELCAAPLNICQNKGCGYDWLYQWSTTECEPGDANYQECERSTPALPTITGYVVIDGWLSPSSIRTAVAAWIDDRSAAEATYGHISTWNTGRVTNMEKLFCGSPGWGVYGCNTAKASFNDDISAWDTSSVTNMEDMFADSVFNRPLGDWKVDKILKMREMFHGAKAFDQDLGWCVDDVDLRKAFRGTKCESTSCGVAQKDGIGICEPWARPCLVGTKDQCHINSPTLIIIIIIVLVLPAAYVHRKKNKEETYVAAARRLLCCLCYRNVTDSNSVTSSQPAPPAESPREEPDEEATASESLESRTQATVKAEEAVEPSSFSKLTSFLFGEREEAPTEEEATALPVVAEAEGEATEQPPPPPPAKHWFSRESESIAPKAEERHQRMADWYNDAPEAAALRAAWGEYPGTLDALQAWPGFVQVTNAFLDAKLDAKLA